MDDLDPEFVRAFVDAVEAEYSPRWGSRAFPVQAVARRLNMDVDELKRICPDPDLFYARELGRTREILDEPDHPSTRGDLARILTWLAGNYHGQSPTSRRLLGLALTPTYDNTRAEQIRELGDGGWRAVLKASLERGITRGDLPPDTDIDTIVDVLAGALTYHSVYGTNWDRVVRMLLDAVFSAAVPVRALEQERFGGQPATATPAVERAFKWIDQVPMGTVLPAADVPLLLMTQAPQKTAVLNGCPVTVSVRLNRNLSAGILSRDPLIQDTDAHGRLTASVRVSTPKPGMLPPYLRADRILVAHGDQVWVAPLAAPYPPARLTREITAGARLGPKWEPGARADVVVRLHAPDDSFGLVRLIDQTIDSTE
ncbi:TetR-like C-terminal domain-containing protein [Actinoplanes sp. NPDC026670]|uniref:TetR-like C-terminal domain-containing protein n=1 Tax=Actinoplanes sp. NPDC026670 TaxID=3154700 RepID=UPI003408609F